MIIVPTSPLKKVMQMHQEMIAFEEGGVEAKEEPAQGS